MAVLVVEDNVLLRMVASDTFLESGLSVYEAGTFHHAITILEQCKDVCAIFTDIQLPGTGNGLALAQYAYRRNPRIPLFITSGRVLPKKQDLPYGARFIAKPYDTSDLKLMIDDIRQALKAGGTN
jgi:two-component system, response regulator PdtaR